MINQLVLPKSRSRYRVQTRSPLQERLACRLQTISVNMVIGDLCDKHGKVPSNYAIVKSCIKGSSDPIIPAISQARTSNPPPSRFLPRTALFSNGVGYLTAPLRLPR